MNSHTYSKIVVVRGGGGGGSHHSTHTGNTRINACKDLEDREGVDFHLWKFQFWYFKLYLLDEILLLVLCLWTLSGRAALKQDLFETL